MNTEKIERRLPELNVKDEGRKFNARAELREIEKALERLLKTHSTDESARVCYAQCATYLETWEAAIERWSSVHEHVPGAKDKALLEIAWAHGTLGNYIKARRNLALISSPYKDSKPARKLRRRLRTWERGQAAQSLAELMEEKGIRKNSRIKQSLIETSLLLRDFPSKDVEYLATSISRTLEQLSSNGVTPFNNKTKRNLADNRLLRLIRSTVSRNQSPQEAVFQEAPLVPVFLCGMGWSGSGAVYDYLRSFSEVSAPFGLSEVKIFEGKGGLSSVLAERDPQPSLCDFVMRQVWGFVSGRNMSPSKAYNQSFVRHFPHKKVRLLAASTEELAKTICNGGRGSVEEAFAKWLKYNLNILSGRMARLCLLNNWVHGYNVALTKGIRGARAYVVLRDPRDQYVDRANEVNRSKISVEKFIRQARRESEKLLTALSDSGEWEAEVQVVYFEDFVGNESSRKALATGLGVRGTSEGNATFFDADKSIKNVGIYKNYKNQEEIGRIERELGFLLPEGRASLFSPSQVVPGQARKCW